MTHEFNGNLTNTDALYRKGWKPREKCAIINYFYGKKPALAGEAVFNG